MYCYETFEGFKVRRKTGPKKKILDFSSTALKLFWEEVENDSPGLSQACGCYIFSIKASRGITPWYVGQSKTSFKDECFQDHKKAQYHEVVNHLIKGTPILTFIARLTPNKKFKDTLDKPEADFVEQQLIQYALVKNPELINVKNTKLPRQIQIPGFLNSPKGRPSKGAEQLRLTLGMW